MIEAAEVGVISTWTGGGSTPVFLRSLGFNKSDTRYSKSSTFKVLGSQLEIATKKLP